MKRVQDIATFILVSTIIFIGWIFFDGLSTLASGWSMNLRQDGSKPVSLYAVPGKEMGFSILRASSVKGYWASDEEIILEMRDQALGEDGIIAHIPPRSQEWGQQIPKGALSDTKPIEISGSFTLPEGLAPGTAVDGRLIGEIVYPEKLEADMFSNEKENLDIPVVIHIIQSQDLKPMNLKHVLGGYMDYYIFLVPVLVVALITLIYTIKKLHGFLW